MSVGVDAIEVTLTVPGGPARRLTPDLNSLRWTTTAIGGYGSFSCQIPGMVPRQQLPHLSRILVTLGQRTLFDGRLEDHELSVAAGSLQTEIQGFGWQRLLDDTMINRAWVKRDLAWTPYYVTGKGMTVTIGQFDPSDPTRIGVRLSGNDAAADTGTGCQAISNIPAGSGSRLKFDYVHVGYGVIHGYVAAENSGGLHVTDLGTSNQSYDYAIPGGSWSLRFLYVEDPPPFGGRTMDSTSYVDFTNIRMVGSTLTNEDAAGGVYGGTVIQDVLDTVTGLTAGQIDTGNEFLIEHIDRTTPSNARSVLDEVNSYHNREWAVWDDKTLSWRAPNLDEPDWVVPSTTFDALRFRSTVATLAKRIELIFNDPAQAANVPGAQQLITSVEATSTDPRNPYVKTGQTKDTVITTGFPMTTTSAQALADKLIGLQGGPPPVTGTGTLHADTVIRTRDGTLMPAWAIRAGEDILIPDLPVDEPLRQGRDGQTLFHIVGADVNLDDRTVTLELDGQGRRADVLMARLAAVTRTVTG